jgi:hypothetical protein
MITLGYWRTRGGDKVRVICVDAENGEQPVVGVDKDGDLWRYAPDGYSYHDGVISQSDLIAPWVDPPKVRECWALYVEGRHIVSIPAEKTAAEYAKSLDATLHHMREVNEAREDAVARLTNLAAMYVAAKGEWSNSFSKALAELDKAGGL